MIDLGEKENFLCSLHVANLVVDVSDDFAFGQQQQAAVEMLRCL